MLFYHFLGFCQWSLRVASRKRVPPERALSLSLLDELSKLEFIQSKAWDEVSSGNPFAPASQLVKRFVIANLKGEAILLLRLPSGIIKYNQAGNSFSRRKLMKP